VQRQADLAGAQRDVDLDRAELLRVELQGQDVRPVRTLEQRAELLHELAGRRRSRRRGAAGALATTGAVASVRRSSAVAGGAAGPVPGRSVVPASAGSAATAPVPVVASARVVPSAEPAGTASDRGEAPSRASGSPEPPVLGQPACRERVRRRGR
jgi:hypothetical protein